MMFYLILSSISVIRLSTAGSIRFIDRLRSNYIVAGSNDGAVRFYDMTFRLVAWFEDLQGGSVVSVSFANTLVDEHESEDDLDQFACPEFIVGTEK